MWFKTRIGKYETLKINRATMQNLNAQTVRNFEAQNK